MKGSLIHAKSLCRSNVLLVCKGQERHIGGHSRVSLFLKGAKKLHPLTATRTPAWDLPRCWMHNAPFEPLAQSELKWVTCKTEFLLAISSVKCVSELHALSIGLSCVRRELNGSGVTLWTNTAFSTISKSRQPT